MYRLNVHDVFVFDRICSYLRNSFYKLNIVFGCQRNFQGWRGRDAISLCSNVSGICNGS